MKTPLFLLLNMLVTVFGFTQVNFGLRQTDSLKHQLSTAIEDTTRASLMANLAEAYRWSKPDSAMQYAQRALDLSRQEKFSRGETAALLSFSVLQRELGNLPLALDLALKALRISREKGFHREEVGSLLRLANVYTASNNYKEALTYYHQAKKKLISFPDQFYSEATAILMAGTFEKMNETDSALYYAELISPQTYNYTTGLAMYYHLLGNIHARLKNERLALSYYRLGIESAEQFGDLRGASDINIRVASIFRDNNQIDSAIYYAREGLNTAELLSYKNRIMAAGSLLAQLYESRDPKQALKYYKVFSAARDSVYSIEKMQAMQTTTFNEKERQHEIEAAKTSYRNKVKIYLLIGGLCLFSIIILILYKNNKHKQKANTLLGKQKLEINIQKTKLQESFDNLRSVQAQLIQSEKMASLGELTAGIAHEIQNPLNFVNNFSEVNVELIEELEQELVKGRLDEITTLTKNLKENEQKINHHGKRADAIVKGMLQHSRNNGGLKEPTDINALADEYLRLAFHGLRAKDKSFNVSTKTNFDQTIGCIVINPQDVGRVILNLITNAFYSVHYKAKSLHHASPNDDFIAGNGYEPTVVVSTKKLNGQIEINVRDNGKGIPSDVINKIFQPFFTTKPTGEGTGLGLSMSYDIIIKGHGGEFKVDTKEGEFAEFKIVIPV